MMPTDAEIIALRKECFGGRFGAPARTPWGDTLKFARALLERYGRTDLTPDQIDAILLAAGSTGEKQVWFTRPEARRAVIAAARPADPQASCPQPAQP
jgi:hypothetical protein